MTLALGVLAALASAVLYAAGVTLQSIEAREAPADESLKPSLLADLVRRKRWVIGTLCVVGGWVTQAGALVLAPITIVQPALAVSVVVLLFIGVRFFGETVPRWEVLAALAIVVGVAGLVAVSPGQSDEHAAPLPLAIGMTVLALVALAPYALRGHRRFDSLVALGAGVAYAWTGFSTKFLADGMSSGGWGIAGVWLAATAAAAGVGLLSEMTALQSRSPIRVFPVVLVTQIVIAVLLAPLLAGESWRPEPLLLVGLAASLAVVAAGTRALASSAAVSSAIDDGSGDAAAADEPPEGWERRNGDRADHEPREHDGEGQRGFRGQREQRGGAEDETGRRDREPDEALSVLHDGEAR